MSTLQFPASPFPGQSFTAENGVTYTYDSAGGGGWTANNPIGIDDEYVEVAGDNMTGNLTLGTDKITLNTDGSATFAGDVDTNGVAYFANRQSFISNEGQIKLYRKTANPAAVLFTAYSDVPGVETEKYQFTAGGDVKIGGTLPNAPKILLSNEGDIQSTSQNGGQLAGFRNQIINGCLKNWQRGTSSNTVDYGADRMFFTNPGAGGNNERDTNAPPESGLLYSYAINEGAILVNSVEIYGNGAPFVQGSQWTFSFYARLDIRETSDNQIEFATGNAGASNANSQASDFTWSKELLPSGWRRYSYTFTVSNSPNAGNNCLRLWFRNAGARNTVTGFQLEPGPVATPFEHRPIGTELALCQRYYEEGKCDGQVLFASVTANGNDFLNLPIAFKVNKRVPPSCTAVLNNGSRTSPGVNNITVTSASGHSSGPSSATQDLSWTADAEL